MTKEITETLGNRLLAALPDECRRLLEVREAAHLPKNRILYETAQRMRFAYFINSGIVSLRAVGEDGRTIQIAMIGREGFVGVPIILYAGKSPYRAIAQTPVEAMKIDADRLVDGFNRSEKLREILLRYCHVQETQVVQSAICNPFHLVKQRLCRLLLMMSDCLDSETVALTQQEIADLLGSHRNTSIAAMRELKKDGLIARSGYRDNRILDRKGLERTTCECYRIVREWTSELLKS